MEVQNPPNVNAGNVTGVLPAANGGTGQSSYSIGDMLYASAATTLSKLAAVAVGRVLKSAGVTTPPVWALPTSVASKNANDTFTDADDVWLFTTGASALTATLPTAIGRGGKTFTVTKVDSSAGSVALLTTSAQTINGIASGVIKVATLGDTITVISDGANWVIQVYNVSITAEYTNNGGTAITADVTNIDYITVVKDRHGIWSGTVLTAPVAGVYLINCNTFFNAGNAGRMKIWKAAEYRALSQAVSDTLKQGTCAVYLTTGEQISIRAGASGTLTNSATLHWISIARLSGPPPAA